MWKYKYILRKIDTKNRLSWFWSFVKIPVESDKDVILHEINRIILILNKSLIVFGESIKYISFKLWIQRTIVQFNGAWSSVENDHFLN